MITSLFSFAVYPSAKSSLDPTSSSSPRPPKHSSDALIGLNNSKSKSNNNNNNFVISAYAGPMMEKEAMTYRLRLCRPFRDSVRQLIVSRNSPLRTTKKRDEFDAPGTTKRKDDSDLPGDISTAAATTTTTAAATTSTITTSRGEAEPSTNKGSSGDERRHSPPPSLSSLSNDVLQKQTATTTASPTSTNTEGSGEMLPPTSTKTTTDSSEKSSVTKITIPTCTQGSGVTPSQQSSTNETKLSSFVTPVKLTPPWSLGSAVRSIGSGDPFQRYTTRERT